MGDQLEQLLINLLRNAVDAAEETKGGVRVGWAVSDESLEVRSGNELSYKTMPLGSGLPAAAQTVSIGCGSFGTVGLACLIAVRAHLT